MTESAAAPEDWEGDVLQRTRVARDLTDYLCARYENKPNEPGFVLAINAEWGFGKTFLLSKWAEDLRRQGYPAVNFDAWRNDFTPEPLIAFIAEIQKSLAPVIKTIPAAKRYWDNAVKKLQVLYKPAGKILLQALAKKITGQTVDELQVLIDDADDANESESEVPDGGGSAATDRAEITKALKKIYALALKEHEGKSEAIKSFKENLSLLVCELQAEAEVKLPVFFFVDELDRCRPDYAIELLEGIKHLFGVPGIYFVVATNMQQLSHSTKAVYGATFEGQRYLKRFFDLEYRLPDPDNKLYAKYLFENASLPHDGKFLTGLNEHNYGDAPRDASIVFAHYAELFGLGLRDQQQVLKIIEAATVKLQRIHSHWLFFLAALYHRDAESFTKIAKSNGKLEHAAFAKLIDDLRPNPSIFNTTSLTDSFDLGYGGRAPRSKETSAIEVAWHYYSLAWGDLVHIKNAHGQTNHFEFPESLFHAVMADLPQPFNLRDPAPTTFVNYPALVSYAGNFS
jgi:hypothetical protein